jgi:hypothetical protein
VLWPLAELCLCAPALRCTKPHPKQYVKNPTETGILNTKPPNKIYLTDILEPPPSLLRRIHGWAKHPQLANQTKMIPRRKLKHKCTTPARKLVELTPPLSLSLMIANHQRIALMGWKVLKTRLPRDYVLELPLG